MGSHIGLPLLCDKNTLFIAKVCKVIFKSVKCKWLGNAMFTMSVIFRKGSQCF